LSKPVRTFFASQTPPFKECSLKTGNGYAKNLDCVGQGHGSIGIALFVVQVQGPKFKPYYCPAPSKRS
jgi:hypothetical protein